jgi:hypothetical protein
MNRATSRRLQEHSWIEFHAIAHDGPRQFDQSTTGRTASAVTSLKPNNDSLTPPRGPGAPRSFVSLIPTLPTFSGMNSAPAALGV